MAAGSGRVAAWVAGTALATSIGTASIQPVPEPIEVEVPGEEVLIVASDPELVQRNEELSAIVANQTATIEGLDSGMKALAGKMGELNSTVRKQPKVIAAPAPAPRVKTKAVKQLNVGENGSVPKWFRERWNAQYEKRKHNPGMKSFMVGRMDIKTTNARFAKAMDQMLNDVEALLAAPRYVQPRRSGTASETYQQLKQQ